MDREENKEIQKKIFAIFSFTMACMLFLLVITYINLSETKTESTEQTAALGRMFLLERIQDNVQDMELDFDAYIYSKDPIYITKCDEHYNALTIDLQNIKEHSENRKFLVDMMSRLEAETKLKIEIEKNNIREIQNNPNYLLKSKSSLEKEKTHTDKIRNIISSLETEGRQVLNLHNVEVSLMAKKTMTLFIITGILMLTILAGTFYVIRRDLIKLNIAEKELNAFSTKINDLYNNAPCGYHSLNKDGYVIEMNDTELRWLGYTKDEVINKLKATDIVLWEDASTFNKKFNELKKDGSISDIELTMIRKDGTIFPVAMSASALYDTEGNFLSSRSTCFDISERKKSNERIAYLATLLNESTDSIIGFDKFFNITSWNKGAELIFGFTQEEALGKLFANMLSPENQQFPYESIRAQLQKNGIWKGESRHKGKDGKTIELFSSITNVFDAKDNFVGYICINQDITETKKLEKELRQLNEDLENEVVRRGNELTKTIEYSSDAYLSIDRQLIITYVNEKAAQLVGKPKSAALGKLITEYMSPAAWEIVREDITAALKNNIGFQKEVDFHYAKRWMEIRCYPIDSGASIFIQEITERKMNEAILAESEKKYRLLFENNPMTMWLFDKETLKFIDVNEAAVSTYGYTREEFLTMTIYDIRPDFERERLEEYRKNNFVVANFNNGAWRHRKKNGEEIFVNIYAHDIAYINQNARLILAIDVTEKIIAEQELQESHQQLRDLSAHLQNIREDERGNIAREIHDELGQQLTGLKLDLSWVKKKMKTEDPEVTEKVQETLMLIDLTVKTVRRIATELRPGILDDLGLIAALDWQSHEFEKRSGIRCEFIAKVNPQELTSDISTGIFRIYQESLTNIARHSNATKVSTMLSKEGNFLKLQVIDNGIGFDVDAAGKKGTLGLLGMKERVLMMNGKIEMKSLPGEGSTFTILAPIESNIDTTLI
ncbi:MAG TPA: PAS domain S-box protein [Bacteroidia bacterium]|jgi:PAS domain S-box-containing protein|nr:PAS domain S-box protein [Bacteroidia bacterium]